MLATMPELMAYAEEKQCAIGSFNTPDIATIRAVIAAAEELNAPVIIMHAQVHDPFAPLDLIGPAMVSAAKNAKVPVCVHLDHGEDADYCRRALEIGFNSVMFDGSTLSYEKNVEITKEVVAIAAKTGAAVEGEIGALGKRELGNGEDFGDAVEIYTDPALAEEYINTTKVDLLACSFGTAHGLYLKAPKLNFDVLTGVRARLPKMPLVMHGGSGVSKEDYKKAIAAGIRKINYYTYMSKAGGEAIREFVKSRENMPLYFYECDTIVYDAMKENAKGAMKMFLGMEE
ncbi:MAG: class II fructose-bisphosphate aldolase [Clostridiales bacterium]|nr:class II fructose-bisphosphate aldolase [Clostridiales bacterium]